MNCIFETLVSEEAGRLGSLLSGIGTVGLVFVAWVQANAWRHQQLKTKKSEVAGRVLTAVIRLFQAMDLLTCHSSTL